MMELADILVLETSAARHTGSTPVIGTGLYYQRIDGSATNREMKVRIFPDLQIPYLSFMLSYVLIGILAACLNHLINYCLGKPGSDKFSPYEIFSFYTVWLSQRRLRVMQLYDKYVTQYNENAERLTSKHEAAQMKRDFDKIFYDAADPFFTWERAVGMCPVCTGVWVSLGVGLVFTVNFVALLTIVVTSHVVIRILSKVI